MKWNLQFEPATVTLTAAAWAALTALSFMVSGPALWQRPGLFVLHSMGAPLWFWWVLFTLDAVALLSSVVIVSPPYRATVALLSALLWIVMGVCNVLSLAHLDILGSYGLWSIFLGLSCLHAVSRWAYIK